MVTSFFLLLGLYFQDGLGYSPIASGLLFTPLAVTFVTASLNTGRLARIPHDRVLTGAATVASAGLLLAALTAAGTVSTLPALPLMAAFVLVGLGTGVFMPTVITTVLGRTPSHNAGSASGVLSTAQQIGNALGVTIGGTVFFSELGSRVGPTAYGDALAAGALVGVAVTLGAAVLALRLRERPERAPATSAESTV
jgi:MFS family permease